MHGEEQEQEGTGAGAEVWAGAGAEVWAGAAAGSGAGAGPVGIWFNGGRISPCLVLVPGAGSLDCAVTMSHGIGLQLRRKILRPKYHQYYKARRRQVPASPTGYIWEMVFIWWAEKFKRDILVSVDIFVFHILCLRKVFTWYQPYYFW